jgi:hypothetical protein
MILYFILFQAKLQGKSGALLRWQENPKRGKISKPVIVISPEIVYTIGILKK